MNTKYLGVIANASFAKRERNSDEHSHCEKH
jgi:hypothetical protein